MSLTSRLAIELLEDDETATSAPQGPRGSKKNRPKATSKAETSKVSCGCKMMSDVVPTAEASKTKLRLTNECKGCQFIQDVVHQIKTVERQAYSDFINEHLDGGEDMDVASLWELGERSYTENHSDLEKLSGVKKEDLPKAVGQLSGAEYVTQENVGLFLGAAWGKHVGHAFSESSKQVGLEATLQQKWDLWLMSKQFFEDVAKAKKEEKKPSKKTPMKKDFPRKPELDDESASFKNEINTTVSELSQDDIQTLLSTITVKKGATMRKIANDILAEIWDDTSITLNKLNTKERITFVRAIEKALQSRDQAADDKRIKGSKQGTLNRLVRDVVKSMKKGAFGRQRSVSSDKIIKEFVKRNLGKKALYVMDDPRSTSSLIHTIEQHFNADFGEALRLALDESASIRFLNLFESDLENEEEEIEDGSPGSTDLPPLPDGFDEE